MLHRLVAAPRRLEEDAEVFPDLFLADVFGEEARPQGQVELLVVGAGVEHFVFRHLRPKDLSAAASAS